MNNLDLVTDEIQALNRLLLRADAYCIYDPTCPFHSKGKGSVVKAFADVLKLASESGTSATVTADDVRAMVSVIYLSVVPRFPALNLALYGALNGNWSGLSYNAVAPIYTAGYFLALPTACLDNHIDDNTFAGFDSIRRTVAKEDPADLEYLTDLSLVVSCGGWPYQSKPGKPLHIGVPLLVVTSDFDFTPTEWSGTFWSQQAPKSTLVVRHGDDHGTLFVPGPARTAEMNFLTTGNFPEATNQTFVTIYPPGSARGPVSDPYAVPVGPLAGDV